MEEGGGVDEQGEGGAAARVARLDNLVQPPWFVRIVEGVGEAVAASPVDAEAEVGLVVRGGEAS